MQIFRWDWKVALNVLLCKNWFDGYTITNLFASYRINSKTTASLSVNNAFNKLAFTEVESDGHAARALQGRSARVSLRYDF